MALVDYPESVTATIVSTEVSTDAGVGIGIASTERDDIIWIQTEDATEKGVAVYPFGTVIFPLSVSGFKLQVSCRGHLYDEKEISVSDIDAGSTITFINE